MTSPDTLKACMKAMPIGKWEDWEWNAWLAQHHDTICDALEAAASAVELGERLATSAEVQTSMAMERTNLRERVKALEAALDGAAVAFSNALDAIHGDHYMDCKIVLANLAAVRKS